MELVEVPVLGTSHEYAAVRCPSHSGHLYVARNGHVCRIHLDLLAHLPTWSWYGRCGHSDEQYGDGGTYHQECCDLVNEDATFGFNERDVGDYVGLVHERAQLLARRGVKKADEH